MSRSRLVPSAILLAATALAGGWLVQRAIGARDRGVRDGAMLLDAVMHRVRTSYVEPVDEERAWQLAMEGMLGELGDPNTAYLDPDRLERLTRSASNSYFGVGLEFDLRDGWITVSQPRPGSPAERAGMQPGDRLLRVDGRAMQGWTLQEARSAFRGPLGTTVDVVVERGTARLSMKLERAEIFNRAVARATVLAGGVGYLAVTTFSDSTETEVVSTVDSLRGAGARSLIIDLRGNPGGLLAQGVGVADLFLSPGQMIVTTKGRIAQASAVHVDETSERWTDLPTVALINQGTASAAEIVAGALQDHDRALVMGQTSYGKGSAQAVYPLENGAALSLTNARWYTPLGRSIEFAAPGELPLADADTARPVFRTAMGRAVFGGGGIVPDVAAGDSAADTAERRFNAELGRDLLVWRQLVRSLATALVAEGAVRDSLFRVTPAWRARLYAMMDRKGLAVSVVTYREATGLVERTLGNEAARLSFGLPYVQRRIVRNDVVVQRAAELLRRAHTVKDVFGE